MSFFSLTTLLERLHSHIQQQQTGVFFIATSDNLSCRFALAQGELTHCSYQRWHGEAALQAALDTIQSGKYAFHEALAYPFRPQASINHQVALSYLKLSDAAEMPLRQPNLKPSGFSQTELEQLFGRFYFE